MDKFASKVALVTGAARGIGRACALELARRGADVVINDCQHGSEAESVAHEVRAMSRRALVVQADVSDRPAMDAMVRRTVAELGQLIVVCFGGFWVRRLPVPNASHPGHPFH